MTFFRIAFLLGGVALTASIIWAMGADGRGLGVVLSDMISRPWTVVTLVDIYLGFFIAAAVIILFERSWPIRLFWALPVFFLGNVWTALWFAIRLPEIVRRLRSVE